MRTFLFGIGIAAVCFALTGPAFAGGMGGHNGQGYGHASGRPDNGNNAHHYGDRYDYDRGNGPRFDSRYANGWRNAYAYDRSGHYLDGHHGRDGRRYYRRGYSRSWFSFGVRIYD